MSDLGETICSQDVGDGEQGGHPGQLRRGQGHSSLEHRGRLRVPAGGQLCESLAADLAAAAGHQES